MIVRNRAYLYLVITTSAWGSLYVVTKVIMGSIPPVTVLFFRYLIASAVMLVILNLHPRVVIERRDYPMIFFIGFVGYFLAICAQLAGTKYTDVSIASLINATNPVIMILLAVPILKEKITVNKIVALAAALGGTYIIIGGAKGNGAFEGVVLSGISVMLWSLVSVFVRRVTRKYDPIVVTAWAVFIAMVCSFPASLIELSIVPHGRIFTVENVSALLYIGIVCTALTHFLWNKSLSLIEAGRCSLFYPIQPLVAVLLGWVLLGEKISVSFVFGAGLIVAGILFSILAGRGKAA